MSRDTSADTTLDGANMGMEEGIKNLKSKFALDDRELAVARAVWCERQPEIDALKMELIELRSELVKSGMERLALIAENEKLRADAERYRWLRAQHWNEDEIAVVCHPRRSVKLGFDCPSLQRLDEYIDAAMKDFSTTSMSRP